MDREAAEAAIRAFLVALGHDPSASEELRETPARVVAAFSEELLSGYGVDVEQLILDGSSEVEAGSRRRDPVVVGELTVVTVCPHHLLVAEGRATLAYVPGRRLLGFGTLARLVDAASRRLVLQESIASEVVEALMGLAGAQGAAIRLVMNHACLRTRGPIQSEARAVTVAARGVLESPAHWGPLLLGEATTVAPSIAGETTTPDGLGISKDEDSK